MSRFLFCNFYFEFQDPYFLKQGVITTTSHNRMIERKRERENRNKQPSNQPSGRGSRERANANVIASRKEITMSPAVEDKKKKKRGGRLNKRKEDA